MYNQFRESYEFTGVPIRIYLKGKQKKEKPSPKVEHGLERGSADEVEEEEGMIEEGDDYHFENEGDIF